MLDGDRGARTIYVRVNALDTGRTLGASRRPCCPVGPMGSCFPNAIPATTSPRRAPGSTGSRRPRACRSARFASSRSRPSSAKALLRLDSYGRAGPRLAGLMWGAEDLAASLGSTSNADEHGFHSPFRLARDLCLIAARAAGVAPIDTVYTRIDDLAGLAAEAAAARRDGFAAKAVIHPKHVDAVNAAFAPTAAEIGWAKQVVEAFARDSGAGVVRIDGRMIDKPHLKAAEAILAIAPKGAV